MVNHLLKLSLTLVLFSGFSTTLFAQNGWKSVGLSNGTEIEIHDFGSNHSFLWIASSQGLLRYDYNQVVNADQGVMGRASHVAVGNQDSVIAFSDATGELFFLAGSTVYATLDLDSILPGFTPFDIALGSDSEFYLAGNTGMYTLNAGGILQVDSRPFRVVERGYSGVVGIANSNELVAFKHGLPQDLVIPAGLNASFIQSLDVVDSQLVVASLPGGVLSFHANQWNTLSYALDVDAVVMEPSGVVWAKDYRNVYRYVPGDVEVFSTYERNHILAGGLLHRWQNNVVVSGNSSFAYANTGIQNYEHPSPDMNELSLSLLPNGSFLTQEEALSSQASGLMLDTHMLVHSLDLWLAAVVQGDTLITHGDYSRYENGLPWASGAYSTNYDFEHNHWVYGVTKQEIDNHILNFGAAGYVVPQSISSWPAHGDVSVGQNTCLAPFIDVNADGVYNPAQGDYPQIRGDKTLYVIANETNNRDSTLTQALHAEVHAMFYAFDDPSTHLQHTVFANYRIVNRGSGTLNNVRVGLSYDFDLGFPQDDFLGCDTLLEMGYVYNGDNTDAGPNGFWQAPPALGSIFLNQDMIGFYAKPSWPIGPPFNPNFQNEQRVSLLYGSYPASLNNPNYFATGNPASQDPDTEASMGNLPGDRQGIQVADLGDISSRSFVELDFAISLALNTGNSAVDAVNDLKGQATILQNLFVNQNFPAWSLGCTGVALSSSETQEMPRMNLKVFPNPAQASIQVSRLHGPVRYQIYTLQGSLVQTGQAHPGEPLDVARLKSGLYLLQLETGERLKFTKE